MRIPDCRHEIGAGNARLSAAHAATRRQAKAGGTANNVVTMCLDLAELALSARPVLRNPVSLALHVVCRSGGESRV